VVSGWVDQEVADQEEALAVLAEEVPAAAERVGDGSENSLFN
jgi:hypothetical protein